MQKQGGFSLIELMIVVVIIAILSAIAIPSYRRYVVRSHRTDAQRALLDLAARQERYFYSNNTYSKDLAGLGSNSSAAGEYYSLGIDPAGTSSSAYLMTATAVGKQKTDDASCQSMSVDQAGRQTSTGSTSNDPACWGR